MHCFCTAILMSWGCWWLTEVTGRVVCQVPVEFSAMSLLQSCTQSKIWQLHVSLRVNKHFTKTSTRHGVEIWTFLWVITSFPCCCSYSGVQQQVVRFDVSVDEAQLVDRVDGQYRLCDVELSGLFRQRVLLHQQRHHVAWQKGQRSAMSLSA